MSVRKRDFTSQIADDQWSSLILFWFFERIGILDNKQRMKIRCLIVFSLVMCLLLYAVGYIAMWQIFRGEEMAANVMGQSLSTSILTSNRGTIYDANGKVLAQSASVWSVTVEPNMMNPDQKELIATELGRILDMDSDYIYGLTQQNSYFAYVKRKVEDDVRQEILDMIEENQIGGGIRLINEYKRYYPYGSTASTVIGFTGTDNIGLEGLEYEYDKELTGTTGRMVSLKDAVGGDMPFQYEQLVSAENGYDLVLTIDETVQSIVEKHLKAGAEEYAVQNGAVAVVMDVNTGAIIALASSNEYDLNDPFTIYDDDARIEIDLLPDEEQNAAYTDALYAQWRNKAVSDTYNPGSVFKSITLASALDLGSITDQTTFTCTGSHVPYPGVPAIGCWVNSYGGSHGLLDARGALTNSCNPYLMQAAAEMGGTNFLDYFNAFGLGDSTGIDLPGEANSIYLGYNSLGPVDLAVYSFGQGFRVTPIQMITAISAVANGGYIVQPHVVSRMLDQDGNIVETADTSYKRQVVSESVAELVTDYMLENATTGSGNAGNVPGYRVAGKTGTSEKVDEYYANPDPDKEMQHIASYCGFAPADDPQYALLVFYDEPTNGTASGGSMAGPTFSKIMSEILPYLGVESKLSESEFLDEVVYAPNVVGITYAEAKDRFAELGLTYSTYGDIADNEIVNMQIPSASETMPAGGNVVVSIETIYAEEDMITVPDFSNYDIANCKYLANINDLQIVITGPSLNSNATAQNQSIPVDTKVKRGSVIEVTVIDMSVQENADNIGG